MSAILWLKWDFFLDSGNIFQKKHGFFHSTQLQAFSKQRKPIQIA